MTDYIRITHSPEETETAGYELAERMKTGTVNFIAMYGDLGAGKTAFVRGVAKSRAPGAAVTSPTYSIVNEYAHAGETRPTLFHFDMYRVTSWDDLYSTGFFDYLDTGVLVIEWSENIEGALPENSIRLTISKGEGDNDRIFEIEGLDI